MHGEPSSQARTSVDRSRSSSAGSDVNPLENSSSDGCTVDNNSRRRTSSSRRVHFAGSDEVFLFEPEVVALSPLEDIAEDQIQFEADVGVDFEEIDIRSTLSSLAAVQFPARPYSAMPRDELQQLASSRNLSTVGNRRVIAKRVRDDVCKSLPPGILDPSLLRTFDIDILRSLAYIFGLAAGKWPRDRLLDELTRLRIGTSTWIHETLAVSIARPRASVGPTVPLSLKSPHDFALRMIRPLMTLLHSQTLMYATQNNHAWLYDRPLSEHEIFSFFCCCFSACLMHSRTANEFFRERDFVMPSDVFSRHRFNEIRRYLHASDNSCGEDKVARLIDIFNATAISSWRHDYSLAVDEELVQYRGRCKYVVYMPYKPGKFGFRMWKLVDRHRYTMRVDLYRGAGTGIGEFEDEALCERTVLDLLIPFVHQRTRFSGSPLYLFTDNFFTTVPLALNLLDRNVYLTGTLKSGRKMIPVDVSCAKPAEGEVVERVLVDGNKRVAAMRWNDHGHLVTLLSTAFGSEPVSSGDPIPLAVACYRVGMRYVDTADQLMHNYLRFMPGTRRWWLVILWWLLYVSLLNALILYNSQMHKNKKWLTSAHKVHEPTLFGQNCAAT